MMLHKLNCVQSRWAGYTPCSGWTPTWKASCPISTWLRLQLNLKWTIKTNAQRTHRKSPKQPQKTRPRCKLQVASCKLLVVACSHTQNINMAIFIYNICSPLSSSTFQLEHRLLRLSTKCATKLHINKVSSPNLRQVLVHVQPFTWLQLWLWV